MWILSGYYFFPLVMPLVPESKRTFYVTGSHARTRQGVLQLRQLLYAPGIGQGNEVNALQHSEVC